MVYDTETVLLATPLPETVIVATYVPVDRPVVLGTTDSVVDVDVPPRVAFSQPVPLLYDTDRATPEIVPPLLVTLTFWPLGALAFCVAEKLRDEGDSCSCGVGHANVAWLTNPARVTVPFCEGPAATR
ncbi:MAG: hypothetical protein U9Q74_08760 [Gemmatimonadota bacterium]|nr:hypothetical protein [Gemmatimonadota bacterium]